MTITTSTINSNYQEVLQKNPGAEFVKVDLHVHTPASGDAQAKNKYNFKFNIADIPASLEAAKQLAEKIVDGALAKGLKLIAVTDHNSPSNTHPEDLTDTWYSILREKAEGRGLTVLPGVEISTDDLHILVSGDAEQVVVTQSEAKLKVVTGDINNKEIQEHILEIFEGDRFALLEKSRKLGRILE